MLSWVYAWREGVFAGVAFADLREQNLDGPLKSTSGCALREAFVVGQRECVQL